MKFGWFQVRHLSQVKASVRVSLPVLLIILGASSVAIQAFAADEPPTRSRWTILFEEVLPTWLGGKPKKEAPPAHATENTMSASGKKGVNAAKVVDAILQNDLTQQARAGLLTRVVGRDAETADLMTALNQDGKSSAGLVGEAGVGKTAVVEGLAQVIVEDEDRVARGEKSRLPRKLQGKRIIVASFSSLMQDTSMQGSLESIIRELVNRVKTDGNIILFIDEFHTIFKPLGSGTTSIGDLLKEALGRGDISVIGATTLNEFRQSIEKDPALDRRFAKCMIGQPGDLVMVLLSKVARLEKHHKLRISMAAIEAAIEATDALPGNQPDKAISLLSQTISGMETELSYGLRELNGLKQEADGLRARNAQLSRVFDPTQKEANDRQVKANREKLAAIDAQVKVLEEVSTRMDSIRAFDQQIAELDYDRMQAGEETPRGRELLAEIQARNADIAVLESEIRTRGYRGPILRYVDSTHIIQHLARRDGLDPKVLGLTIADRIKRVSDHLNKYFVGHDSLKQNLLRQIKARLSGAADPKKPLSILLMAPQGSGKDALVNAIRTGLLGETAAVVRIDGSEFVHITSEPNLVETTSGLVGHADRPRFQAVRESPACVVVIDHIELVSPGGMEKIMQAISSGTVVGGQGIEYKFGKAVVVAMTSLGSDVYLWAREAPHALELMRKHLEGIRSGSLNTTLESALRTVKEPQGPDGKPLKGAAKAKAVAAAKEALTDAHERLERVRGEKPKGKGADKKMAAYLERLKPVEDAWIEALGRGQEVRQIEAQIVQTEQRLAGIRDEVQGKVRYGEQGRGQGDGRRGLGDALDQFSMREVIAPLDHEGYRQLIRMKAQVLNEALAGRNIEVIITPETESSLAALGESSARNGHEVDSAWQQSVLAPVEEALREVAEKGVTSEKIVVDVAIEKPEKGPGRATFDQLKKMGVGVERAAMVAETETVKVEKSEESRAPVTVERIRAFVTEAIKVRVRSGTKK